MTTPNGTPTGGAPGRGSAGSGAADAAAQANAAGSESKVLGSNQDKSSTGAADATSALSTQKSGRANPAGPSRFTGTP